MGKKWKPIICLDFDGVIHSYTSGYQGLWRIPDPPVDGAIEWLYSLYEADRLGEINAVVAIYSTRSKSIFGRMAMRAWLARHVKDRYGVMAGPLMDPVYLDLVEWIQWPRTKPPALVTVDDRAITFTGKWPNVDDLLEFRPWNKGLAQ